MKTMTQTLIGVLLSVSLFFPILSGCEQQGPAERAGEAIDEATEKGKENIEEAGEAMNEATEEAREKIEEVGEKVQDSMK